MTDFELIVSKLPKLTLAELEKLHKVVVALHKEELRRETSKAAESLVVGGKVEFNASRDNGRLVTCKILKVNRTTALVIETDESGKPGAQWRVATTLLRPVAQKKV